MLHLETQKPSIFTLNGKNNVWSRPPEKHPGPPSNTNLELPFFMILLKINGYRLGRFFPTGTNLLHYSVINKIIRFAFELKYD